MAQIGSVTVRDAIRRNQTENRTCRISSESARTHTIRDYQSSIPTPRTTATINNPFNPSNIGLIPPDGGDAGTDV